MIRWLTKFKLIHGKTLVNTNKNCPEYLTLHAGECGRCALARIVTKRPNLKLKT